MKSDRQGVILEIIGSENIENQKQLMAALEKRGLRSTQATLSRDIKELHLVKEMSPEGFYRYAVSPEGTGPAHSEKLRKIFRECVTDCDTAQNIVVIKTLPGMANAATSAIDSMTIDSLVGSVAGDDTAFLAMRDSRSAETFLHEIRELFRS